MTDERRPIKAAPVQRGGRPSREIRERPPVVFAARERPPEPTRRVAPPRANMPKPLDRICGPAAVAAIFAKRPEAVVRLFYQPTRRDVAGPFCAQMAKQRRPYREVGPEELARIAGTEHHGGIVAVAEQRVIPLLTPADLAGLMGARVVVVLDGIGNPHNLGAIARSAAFFGAPAMLLTADPRQSGLPDAALRTSEGGLEHLALFRVPDLTALAADFRLVAAMPRGGVAPGELARDKPIALVLGNEEQGLSAASLALCADSVTLPGSGAVESLNVSVAAAVLLHALSS